MMHVDAGFLISRMYWPLSFAPHMDIVLVGTFGGVSMGFSIFFPGPSRAELDQCRHAGLP